MLTLERLKEMTPGTIFETGNILNQPGENSIYMSDQNQGKPLRWVAVVGGNNDWAIYCFWSGRYSDERIKTSGQKVGDIENVKKLVLCDEEALKRYRR